MVDGEKKESEQQSEVRTVAFVKPELEAPVWVSAEQVEETIVLKWNAVESASGYNVYMAKDGGEYALAETTDAAELTLSGLAFGSTYAFKLAAYDLVEGEKVESTLMSEEMTVVFTAPVYEENGFVFEYTADKSAVVITEYNGSAADVVIPDTYRDAKVVEIADGVFAGNTAIKTVTMSSNVTKLGTGVFKGCTALTDAVLSTKLTEVADETFSGCAALESVSIPNAIEVIGVRAFYNCSSLSTMNLL